MFNIGRGYGKKGIRQLLAEIEKCDVVCANCHRIRTEGRSFNGRMAGLHPVD